MPTYEYQCDACGHKFERFQSIKADPIRACPQCRKNKVRRLISTGAGLIFRGSGFYITDYRSESYKDAAKAESGTSTGGDTKPADKGAAKPEPGAESAKPATSPPAAPPPSPKARSASKPAKET